MSDMTPKKNSQHYDQMHDMQHDLQSPLVRIRNVVNQHPHFSADAGLIHIARSPGRLDVMGGIADYTGSRVCQMPLQIEAAAAVQMRTDGKVICMSQQAMHQGELVLQADELLTLNSLALRERIGSEHAWAGYVAGALAWLMKHQDEAGEADEIGASDAAVMQSGVTLLIDSDVPAGGGVSSSAAIELATMFALASLYEISLGPMQIAAACQNVENQVVGAPCGVMDQVVSCMGKRDSILQILCQPDANGMPAQVEGQLEIPRGYAFVGVHSGVRHEVRGDPYGDTRVAAFMARKIIRSISVPHEHLEHMAQLPLKAYEQNLREQLPVTMTGQAFIDAFQSTGDHATTITPDRAYFVRDAADHHVREMHRVTEFASLLNQINKRKQDRPHEIPEMIAQLGVLMNQSHHSYSRYARLGHPLTDQLASLLNEAGQSAGIFGCRITGGGCGGTLAILLHDTPETYQAIEQIRQRYETMTGRTTMLFAGTSDGGVHTPVERHTKTSDATEKNIGRGKQS